MARIFTAITLPEKLRERLVEIQQQLDDGFAPVAPEQMHITLQFFEDIEQPQIAALKRALDAVDVPPFEAEARGIDAFPSIEYIRVIWAGIISDRMRELYQQVSDHEVPVTERHDFRPHITILRVKDVTSAQKERLQEKLRRREETELGVFEVDSVVLYESKLHPDGSEYTVRHKTDL